MSDLKEKLGAEDEGKKETPLEVVGIIAIIFVVGVIAFFIVGGFASCVDSRNIEKATAKRMEKVDRESRLQMERALTEWARGELAKD